MDNQPSPNPNSGDKKQAPQGGSFIWYLLALGVGLLFLVTMLTTGSQLKIKLSDFEKLVVASKQDVPEDQLEEHPGWITIEKKKGDVTYTYKISMLDNVVVGDEAVTGTVTQKLESVTGTDAALDADDMKPVEEVRFQTNRVEGDGIPELLRENGIERQGQEPDNPLLGWIPFILMMTVFVGLFVFMIRRMGGAGSPMAFGRSRGKLYAQEDIDITFDDVAGIEEAVDELREVVDFLKNPERYQRLGGRIPKGVLLVGPPGTGKTLLGKAVAGEAGVPFFSISGSDFVEMFVGVGAARVRDMFQQAEQRAPCIIFIDELDALGKTRGSGNLGGHDEREQTLNALLVEMDGFGSNSGVIVMGATNRPETLDPALLRPGRFDRHVLVDRPDVSGREEILEVHLQKIKVDSEVDVKALAGITSGFVGADLANMVNEAALLAARNGKELVGMEEFNEAVERVSVGLEKRSRIIQEDEKLRLAYHEAGHALVAYSLPNTDPVHKVSIIPRGLGALGYMMQRPEKDRFMMTRGQLESDIQVCLAGTLSEELVFDDVGNGATSDLERATETARSMVMDYGMSRLGRIKFREGGRGAFLAGSEGPAQRYYSEQTAREIDQEVKRIIDEQLDRTRGILESRRLALDAIANTLIEHEVIDGSTLQKVIEESHPSPRLVPGTDLERKPTPAPQPKPSEGDTAEGTGGA
ncbi:ATP-dependent zinc metalloprotease FtsH [Aeoliella mucimassa]|uniref:ATP-dependent zinc metalloprotease FtsH n=1 Tax=Aeoliella mucimassa TaxID=2527972 RepID=A0A518AHG4_9BACT|nr:ATP-dependent zinc metalloprotease FtsH [Aeoliella mucimassa]QDU54124.1 ATP-dependent zinc metalloprotease FtsH 4 [Aeoliella mucimassa]